MRFEIELDIDAPADEVWRAFNDPSHLPRWQPNLQSYEGISGEPGWPGAVSLLVYHEKGRRIEMTETVREREEGRRYSGSYENAWSVNDMTCTFTPLDNESTRWHAVVQYRLKGWVKLLSVMLRNGIRARVLDDMLRFKSLVESGAFRSMPPPSSPESIRQQPRR